MAALLSTADLAASLDDPAQRLLDASAHPLDPSRDAAAEHDAGHIPHARFLDLATLVDPDHPAPGMAPDAATFAARLGGLGVAVDDHILLYDDAPHHTSCRAWWLLRRFGARDVAILDGGLAKWRREGRALATGREDVAPVRFVPAAPLIGVRDKAEMLGETAQIVDARSAARFSGREADPRPGVAPGHIPGSINLRYDALFAPDGTWKRGDALRAAFEAAGIDLARPIVTTCGSGVTAAILLFGLHLLGIDDTALYDGSWSEWGADPATPKALGA